MAELAGEAAVARVLIVDDHELAREALISVLGREPDLELVGEAADGSGAIEMAGRLRPDLVVMDVRMPGTDGLAATQAIKRALPGTKVLLFTTYDAQEYALAGMRIGADAYLPKGASKQELLGTLRAVLRGEQSVQSGLAASVLRQVALDRGEPWTARPPLTDRQRDILRLVAAGRSNPEIASELHVSLNTVKTHVVHVLRRLGVTDRTQAAVRVAQLGLLEDAWS